jgi:broad specificity phosphatase PhoE
MRLILIRHGQTQWNREQRIQGWLDSPLTENALAELQRMPLPQLTNPLLLSSDQGRAKHSAEIIGQRLQIQVRSDARLRERNFGILQGRVINQEQQLQQEWAQYQLRYQQQLTGVAGVEPEAAFARRIRAVLHELAQRHTDRDVVIVGHGEWLRVCRNIIHCVPSWHYGEGIPVNAAAVEVVNGRVTRQNAACGEFVNL